MNEYIGIMLFEGYARRVFRTLAPSDLVDPYTGEDASKFLGEALATLAERNRELEYRVAELEKKL